MHFCLLYTPTGEHNLELCLTAFSCQFNYINFLNVIYLSLNGILKYTCFHGFHESSCEKVKLYNL